MKQYLKQKRIITLPKKVKRKLTRRQTILRNVLTVTLMIAVIAIQRKGTFTEQQAYERQLQLLGITENAIKTGSVQVLEDRRLESAEEMDPVINYRDADFEPIRQVVMESAAGGKKVNVIIVVGQRGFLWYDAAWGLEYLHG